MEKGGGNMIGELNIYSCYSFQNSTILIQDLCKRAKELHMEALALTDINNMYGAIEFSNACHHYDIKPIFGMQGDVLIDQEVYPFLFYAKDQIGYHDLMKICSDINNVLHSKHKPSLLVKWQVLLNVHLKMIAFLNDDLEYKYNNYL